MYRNMNAEEKERIVKFILCFVIGLTVSALIGFPYSPTIAVSAILMLYIDRGYIGSFTYSRRRIMVQVVMGGVGLLMIYGIRAVFPALPDWITGIIVSVIAIVIFLPIQYKHPIAPLTVTMGNATLIMVTGILKSPAYYWQRVLFCVVGAAIAHVVNYVIMPQKDRFAVTTNALQEATGILVAQAQGLPLEVNAASRLHDAKATIDANLKHILADNKLRKFHRDEECIALLQGLSDMVHKLEAMLGREGSEDYRRLLSETVAAHHMLLENFLKGEGLRMETLSMPEATATGPEEIALYADLFKYRRETNRLIEVQNLYLCRAVAEGVPELIA